VGQRHVSGRVTPGGLRITGESTRDGVLRLQGELDLATRTTLLSAIRGRPEPPGDVRLDASELSFIDCAGLGLLVELATETRASGQRFEITASSPALTRLTRFAGLTEL
jgi:anti-anti-sigma factor